MEKLKGNLPLIEVILSVGLIGLLIYFHKEENKKHKEMMDSEVKNHKEMMDILNSNKK